MGIVSVLASENYITFNKTIAKKFGIDEAILLGQLCSWYSHYNSEFFKTVDEICEQTCLTEYRMHNAMKNLQSSGIVSYQRKGMPAQNYYSINEEMIEKELDIHGTRYPKFGVSRSTNFEASCSPKIEASCSPKIEASNNIINNKNKKENIKNKENNKEKEVVPTFDDIISSYNFSDRTVELIWDWMKQRSLNKIKMTNAALKLNLDKLRKYAKESSLSEERYMEEIVARGWRGFYPISGGFAAEEIVEINGQKYLKKGERYFVPNGCGVEVNPFAKNDLPY